MIFLFPPQLMKKFHHSVWLQKCRRPCYAVAMWTRSTIGVLSVLVMVCPPRTSHADAPACPTVRLTDGENARLRACLLDARSARESGQYGLAIAAYREALVVAREAYERDSAEAEFGWFLDKGSNLVHYGTIGCVEMREFATFTEPTAARQMLVDCATFLDLHATNIKELDPTSIAKALLAVQERRKTVKEALDEVPEPSPPPPPVTGNPSTGPVPPSPQRLPALERPWRSLLASGVVLTSLGTAMMTTFGVAVWQTSEIEREFKARECSSGGLNSSCSDIYARGMARGRTAVASLILGPLLLGAGAALITVGLRRKYSRWATTKVRVGHFMGLQLQF